MADSDKEMKPVSIAEVKEMLTKASKEREDLLYEQKIALEHTQKLGKLTLKQTKDLIKDLIRLELFDEKHAYKIADLLPLTTEEIIAIFAKEKVPMNENKAKKIVETVKKHYSK